ncbi:MAG: HAMP domain-containing histidine kinase [Candidatus Nanopelagicales bacterium]|nr:HAMP domain-containing histidine kinase [Candidatus Nanopelagicales bacterium]
MRSLRTTVALIVSITLALTVVALAISIWTLTRNELLNSVDNSLVTRIQAGVFLTPPDPDGAPFVRPPIPGQPTVIVDAVLADGEVYDIDDQTYDLPVDALDVQLASAAPGTSAFSTRITPEGESVRVYTVAVVDGAAARAIRSLEETQANLFGLATILAIGSVAAVAVGAAAGVLAVRRSTTPLTQAADAMAALSRGERDAQPPRAERGAPREVVDVVNATTTLQNELARSRAQQEQLVQDAGHELRTPLASLRANVQFAARTASDELTIQSLSSAQAELDELGRLVEELLALAARDEPVRDVVELDLVGAVRVAADRLTRRTGRTVTLDTPDHPVPVTLEPIGLAEIVGNCLDNAAKFTPADAAIRAVVREHGDEVVIEINDGGPGIPAAQRDAVWERFHRTPDARGLPGSGLGLAIVLRAAEAAGGSVVLDEAKEGGLAVRITLPRTPLMGDIDG